MINEQGIIEKVNKGKALVRIQRRSACESCSSKGSCSISARDVTIEVPNDLKAEKGDRVEISVPDGALLKISALVYLFPIIALMIGAFMGASFAKPFHADPSVTAIFGAAIFMGIAYFCLKMIERKRQAGGSKDTPRMTRILVNETSPQTCDSR